MLAARGHIALHQRLGLFGIALAGAMVLSGLLAAVVTLHGAFDTPREPVVRANTALSLGAMLMFSTFMGLAVANLAKPERHKRYIVLAMFSILQAAIARIILLAPAISHPLRTLLGAIAVDVLLLGVIAFDARKHGRIHPVYVGGFVFLAILQFVRRAVLHTRNGSISRTGWLRWRGESRAGEVGSLKIPIRRCGYTAVRLRCERVPLQKRRPWSTERV